MEDLDYKAMQDAVSGRLATETLRFLVLARARHVPPAPADAQRITWLESLLLRSLGGARLVSLEPAALAPDLDPEPARVDEELESFASLQRFSRTNSPEAHAKWVEAGVTALDKLASTGWTALDAGNEVPLVEDTLLPLLRWMSGANDRAWHGATLRKAR